MGHQRFETWLLEDEPLTSGQRDELAAHLDSCQACRTLADSWRAVEHRLSSRKWVEPATGFTVRWQKRLAAAQAQSERRINLVILSVATAAAIFLLALMVVQVFFAFETPAEFFLIGANQVARTFSGFNVALEVLAVMVDTLPEVFLIGLWVGLTGLAVMSVLWIISIHQFTFQRRILQ